MACLGIQSEFDCCLHEVCPTALSRNSTTSICRAHLFRTSDVYSNDNQLWGLEVSNCTLTYTSQLLCLFHLSTGVQAVPHWPKSCRDLFKVFFVCFNSSTRSFSSVHVLSISLSTFRIYYILWRYIKYYVCYKETCFEPTNSLNFSIRQLGKPHANNNQTLTKCWGKPCSNSKTNFVWIFIWIEGISRCIYQVGPILLKDISILLKDISI